MKLCEIDRTVLDQENPPRRPKALSAAMRRRYAKMGVTPTAPPKLPAGMRPRQFQNVLKRARSRLAQQ